MIEAETASSLPKTVRLWVVQLRQLPGVRAVLFYGSGLWQAEADARDVVYDFYLLVSGYRAFQAGRGLAVAGHLLPPNVYFEQADFGSGVTRCKYAVLTVKQFIRAARGRSFTPHIWARFAQPYCIAHSDCEALRHSLIEASLESVLCFHRRVFHLVDTATPRECWQAALRTTYADELRSEPPSRVDALFEANARAFKQRTVWAVAALPTLAERVGADRVRSRVPPWRRGLYRAAMLARRPFTKLVVVARLVKAGFTFKGGLEYAQWKVSGIRECVWNSVTSTVAIRFSAVCSSSGGWYAEADWNEASSGLRSWPGGQLAVAKQRLNAMDASPTVDPQACEPVGRRAGESDIHRAESQQSVISQHRNRARNRSGTRESTGAGLWHKPLRNAAKLGLGRDIQAVCSLACLGVSTRCLGTDDFGALVLIHSLSLAMAQLARFQSWAFTIRFGTLALGKASPGELHRVLNFGLTLDWIGVLLRGGHLCSGIFGAGAVGRPSGSQSQLRVALRRARGDADQFRRVRHGMLRLLDRFTALAWQSTLEPLVRLGGSVVVLCLGGGLRAFLIVWLLALLVNKVGLICAAVGPAIAGLAAGFRFDPSAVWRADPGMWRFAWGTQWDATLKLGQRHLPMLLVGSLAGVSAAGLFKVAQQFSDGLVNLNSKLLVPAMFPEIARLTDTGQVAERKAMMLKASAVITILALAVILVFAILGRQLIAAIAGTAFTGAYETMLWLAFAGLVGAAGFTLEPFLLAHGDTRSVVHANALALVVHSTLLLWLLPRIGLVGSGIAAVAQMVAQTLLLIGFIGESTRRGRQALRGIEINVE